MTVQPTEPLYGILFDIQRLSLQDGPGVRTSVFFKGCPLRCAWCHNPESLSSAPQLYYNAQLCTGCGACVKACPYGAHRLLEKEDGSLVHELNHSLCNVCKECVSVCCYNALSILGKQYTVQELLDIVRRDVHYYGTPDSQGNRGGITVTGGEPMMQFPFLLELLKNKGDIHACLETCGYAPLANFQQIAPHVDLFLFDYKATSPEVHKALCGVDNRLILENLAWLYGSGARIVLRLPLIPGVNDDQEHLAGIAALLGRYPRIIRAEIMAYHRLGMSKAEGLGMEKPRVALPTTSQEQKEQWLESLRALGAQHVILG